MTAKEQLLQELDQVPEPMLKEVLVLVLALKAKQPVKSEKSDVWNAYLASKKEREEVYRVPEPMLKEVLEFVLALKAKQPVKSEKSDVWNAYLASKKEREEVYRRLANS
jgi:predicted kinase